MAGDDKQDKLKLAGVKGNHSLCKDNAEVYGEVYFRRLGEFASQALRLV